MQKVVTHQDTVDMDDSVVVLGRRQIFHALVKVMRVECFSEEDVPFPIQCCPPCSPYVGSEKSLWNAYSIEDM